MTEAFSDLFGDILKNRRVPRPNDTTLNRAANRQECVAKGHKYQVHGKTNPTKVACSRCEVFWAIGPRTEPST